MINYISIMIDHISIMINHRSILIDHVGVQNTQRANITLDIAEGLTKEGELLSKKRERRKSF